MYVREFPVANALALLGVAVVVAVVNGWFRAGMPAIITVSVGANT